MKITDHIEFTLLHNSLTKDELLSSCSMARAYNFSSLCTTNIWTKLSTSELYNSVSQTSSVIDYPYGNSSIKAQHCQIIDSLNEGANIITICLNIGLFNSFNETEFKLYLKQIKLLTSTSEIYLMLNLKDYEFNTLKFILNTLVEQKINGVVFDINNDYDFEENYNVLSLLNVDDNLKIKVYDNNISYDNFNKLLNLNINNILTSNAIQLVKDHQIMEGRNGTV